MKPIRPYANENRNVLPVTVAIIALTTIILGTGVILLTSQKSCPDDRIVITKYQGRVVENWP